MIIIILLLAIEEAIRLRSISYRLILYKSRYLTEFFINISLMVLMRNMKIINYTNDHNRHDYHLTNKSITCITVL